MKWFRSYIGYPTRISVSGVKKPVLLPRNAVIAVEDKIKFPPFNNRDNFVRLSPDLKVVHHLAEMLPDTDELIVVFRGADYSGFDFVTKVEKESKSEVPTVEESHSPSEIKPSDEVVDSAPEEVTLTVEEATKEDAQAAETLIVEDTPKEKPKPKPKNTRRTRKTKTTKK